ncbi:hypothetical protein V6767_20165 [Martelella sp. FLE1502]
MLAMKFFGNGYGMGAPYHDQKFYWLVDTALGRETGYRHGRFYTFSGGLGAQLNSFEWRCPKPGTRRFLGGKEFAVFSASRGRYGLMWDVAWAMVSLPRDVDGANAAIRQFGESLGRA